MPSVLRSYLHFPPHWGPLNHSDRNSAFSPAPGPPQICCLLIPLYSTRILNYLDRPKPPFLFFDTLPSSLVGSSNASLTPVPPVLLRRKFGRQPETLRMKSLKGGRIKVQEAPESPESKRREENVYISPPPPTPQNNLHPTLQPRLYFSK